MDRDLVHRQTACAVVQHMSLGVAGLGCEDALTHLLNYVFPNIFEVSPHIIQVRRREKGWLRSDAERVGAVHACTTAWCTWLWRGLLLDRRHARRRPHDALPPVLPIPRCADHDGRH